jgi:hypothetical protein
MSDEKQAMKAPAGGAVVRMYGAGLGDCFLLGFPADDGGTVFMMIDCGALKGTKKVKSRMQRIMNSIADATENRGIEILVATHKHWDHLSGFHQASTEFKKLNIKRVWMGWTEDPTDPAAIRLRAEERSAAQALRAAAVQLRKAGVRTAPAINSLLEFEFGPGWDTKLAARQTTDDLMEIVRGCVDSPDYLRPSLKPESMPNAKDVNIYVLGPPTDLTLLKKSKPSKGQSKETYVRGVPINEFSALFVAASLKRRWEPGSHEEWLAQEFTYPFDPEHGIGEKIARRDPEHRDFFEDHYYSRKGGRWRRVDTTWLGLTEHLALAFDRHRNNTSVVLAIELGTGGPVLLFPGDAQVGNWLSWHELKGSPHAKDLLRRTVLYKVGHHASHNATLKKLGLQLMRRKSKLVAMIPVDQGLAKKPKGKNKDGWDMPHKPLLKELQARTEKRVLRSDEGDYDEGKWKRYVKAPEVVGDVGGGDPLYIQYTVDPR